MGGKVELAIQPDYSPAKKVDGTDSAPTELRAHIELCSWYDVEDVSADSSRGVLMTKLVEAAPLGSGLLRSRRPPSPCP